MNKQKVIYVHEAQDEVFTLDEGETMTPEAQKIEKRYMALGYDGAVFEDEFGDVEFTVLKFTLLDYLAFKSDTDINGTVYPAMISFPEGMASETPTETYEEYEMESDLSIYVALYAVFSDGMHRWVKHSYRYLSPDEWDEGEKKFGIND